MVASGRRWRVVWSGDETCRRLAEVLADERPVWAGDNRWEALVTSRATLLVTSKLPTFDRCSVAVPHDLGRSAITAVVAAVGGGPHSMLAAATARRIGVELEVPARILTGYRRPEERAAAHRLLGDIAQSGLTLPMEAVATDSPPDIVASLSRGTLLVIGAPGGSWFQRQLFGPGVRLQAAAPAGAVIVREAAPRVYQYMRPPDAVGVHMRVRDALEVAAEPVVLVAEFGRLVGAVNRSRLMLSPGHVPVGSIAERPIAIAADEPIAHVELIVREQQGGPVAVVDEAGRLIGVFGRSEILAAEARDREEDAS